MQQSWINNFRARLRNSGYTQISIKHSFDRFYLVSALEPLGGFRVSVLMDIFDMNSWR